MVCTRVKVPIRVILLHSEMVCTRVKVHSHSGNIGAQEMVCTRVKVPIRVILLHSEMVYTRVKFSILVILVHKRWYILGSRSPFG